MDPARTHKLARRAEQQQQQFASSRDRFPSRGGRGGGRGARGGSRGGGFVQREGRGEGEGGGAAAATGPERTSAQRPGRSTPYARPDAPRPPSGHSSSSSKPQDASTDKSTKVQTSLSLSSLPLPTPLPSLASHPHLNRLDLSKVSGALDGVGAGWIGDAWGAQLTWLNLSFCSGLGEGSAGWKGFEKLSGLVVLNVSSCALAALPQEFANLTSLKAFVATHNALTAVPEDVVSQWTLLNSLILSHNPLKALPQALTTLAQLAKLSVSNTALSASSLPDLSPLPFLRMLSASHTAALAALPPHFRTWGTGVLPAAAGSRFDRPNNRNALGEGRRGDGLEVVELGGSALTWAGLAQGVGEGMPGLRSLGLKGCPVTEKEDYKDSVLALLPALQILDNARLVERKRKGPALVQPLSSFQAAKVPGKDLVDAAEVAERAKRRGVALAPVGERTERAKRAKRDAPATEAAEAERGGGEEETPRRKTPRTREADGGQLAHEQPPPQPADDPAAPAGKKRKRKPHSAAAVPQAPTAKADALATAPATPAVAEADDAPPQQQEGKKARKRKPHSAPATSAASGSKDAEWRKKQAAKAAAASAASPADDTAPRPGATPAASADAAAQPAEKGKRKRRPRGASPAAAADAPPAAPEKTSVLKVVEVKPARRGKKAGGKASSAGGVDLEAVFGKKEPGANAAAGEGAAAEDAGSGAFGTGGWDD